jgi:iron(III) transport system ATP-binding protein
MNRLDVRSVSRSFGTIRAVDDVSFGLADGKRMAVVGPSGCGKTTLLRLIAGFEFPDAGTIALDGTIVAATPAFRRGIGYLPQDGALFPHLTVGGNIGFGLDLKGRERSARVCELMKLVALDPAMVKRAPHELSGGQQQRVALARALALRPRLMLLDEPFSALDANLRTTTRAAIAAVLEKAGIATILVTHDRAEALSFPDELAIMRDGKIIQRGPPADLFARPGDAFTAEMLGDAVILPAEMTGGHATCALGAVPVDDRSAHGPGHILFRPEQLRLSAGDSSEGVPATVASVEYTGHACTALVRINHHANAITVRCSPEHPPVIGDQVRVTAPAMAHVLFR